MRLIGNDLLNPFSKRAFKIMNNLFSSCCSQQGLFYINYISWLAAGFSFSAFCKIR